MGWSDEVETFDIVGGVGKGYQQVFQHSPVCFARIPAKARMTKGP